jgi:hypothetical protein
MVQIDPPIGQATAWKILAASQVFRVMTITIAVLDADGNELGRATTSSVDAQDMVFAFPGLVPGLTLTIPADVSGIQVQAGHEFALAAQAEHNLTAHLEALIAPVVVAS